MNTCNTQRRVQPSINYSALSCSPTLKPWHHSTFIWVPRAKHYARFRYKKCKPIPNGCWQCCLNKQQVLRRMKVKQRSLWSLRAGSLTIQPAAITRSWSVRHAAPTSKTLTCSRTIWRVILVNDLLNVGAAKWLLLREGPAIGMSAKKRALIRRRKPAPFLQYCGVKNKVGDSSRWSHLLSPMMRKASWIAIPH